MKNRFQHIIEGNIYQGLEIFEIDNSKYYTFLKLYKKKGELTVSFEELFTDLDNLVASVDNKKALAVVLNTSKVLKKKISNGTPANVEQWVAQAFPNLDLENFYYQVLDSADFKVVSISKKSEVDIFLKQLRQNGIVPSKIAIGISELSNTLPYLHFPVHGSSFYIDENENAGPEINNSDKMEGGTIDMNGLTLSRTSLLSFSSILGTVNHVQVPSNLQDINLSLDHGFKNRRFFSLGSQLGLGALLVLLLLNFVLFSHYRSKTLDMDTIASLENQSNLLNLTKDRIANKESKLNALMNSSNSKVTFYLDQIGNSLPASILLDKLDYQPLLKPVQDDKPIEMVQNTMIVTGLTNNKEEFTSWADDLEKMDWIKTIEIQSLEFDTKNSDRFTLKIGIHEAGQ
ncbi:hypothetical protein [Flagellimonas beolgyonensis]|uniref:hypothetical protein n=1 Tax=Flagellimonas beolgyonensis TaxID=864064 RepID=UPI000F8EF0E7|nr:hypothetical protein [Allomuricauda beolgyonensis]